MSYFTLSFTLFDSYYLTNNIPPPVDDVIKLFWRKSRFPPKLKQQKRQF